MAPQLEQQLTMISFYIYRDISNEALSSYSKHLTTEMGRKEVDVLLEGLNAVLGEWSHKTGTQLSR